MALQSSGQIDISDIQTELGSSSGSLRTLSAAAGFSVPDAMSEFYGYSAFNPADHFAPITYSGTSSTRSITTGFQPDLVWIKCRNQPGWNRIADAVRGVNKQIASNSANNESTYTNELTSFNSNGFTLGNSADVNGSPENYVAWSWKGGNGTVTNTNGTVTTTVSANQAAGFSIATYTGPGYTGSNVTVGHGLSQAPELYIVKNRSYSADWLGWNTVTPSSGTDYFFLNSTAQFGPAAQPAPTSTVNYLQTSGNFESVYGGHSYVMYSWHSVSGYSKVGKYTGNGNSTGPIITTGFQPRFLMLKLTDGTGGNWQIMDSSRGEDIQLYANLNNAEGPIYNGVDFLSNGFQPKTSYVEFNGLNKNYLYLAIA